MHDFDLPDTESALSDRIQYLEWVAENCSRSTWKSVRAELEAARKKLDALKLDGFKHRYKRVQSTLSQAA